MSDKLLRFSGFQLAIRAEFEERISRKTGWDKNELMNEYDRAVNAVLVRYVDSREKR